MTTLLEIFHKEKFKISKFSLVGIMGLVWKSILLYLLVENNIISEQYAIIPIFFVIGIHNYILNNKWTFKDSDPKAFALPKYILLNSITFVIYTASYWLLLVLGIQYIISSILAVGLGAVLNFILVRANVWQTKN